MSVLGDSTERLLGEVSSTERLRVALLAILQIPNREWGFDWEEIEEARRIAAEALGVPCPASHEDA